jgi:hypothetical protein
VAVASRLVHPRRLNSAADRPGASGLEDGVERCGEAGVPVMQDELCPGPGVFQVHQEVPGLLHYPRLDRMLGGPEDADAAGAVLNGGQDVDDWCCGTGGGSRSRAASFTALEAPAASVTSSATDTTRLLVKTN